MKKNELMNYILENGGCTIKSDGSLLMLEKGYQVALQGTEYQAKTASEAVEKLLEYASVYGASGFNFGVWYSDERRCYCVDISTTIQSLDDAIRLGDWNKQEAIFDWATGKSIDL